jgi:hypothetical protein
MLCTQNRKRRISGGRGLEALQISVTRHAIQRYLARGLRHATSRQIEREIGTSVLAEIDFGTLFRVTGRTHLAVIATERRRLCAVLDVEGPVEKPFAITVCTVLTAEMAINSYGHLPGLIEAVDGTARHQGFNLCQVIS